jgi:serine phosphatase RsbU (regulator of sigma subunit)
MEKSPAKVLSRVNDQLCENNDSGYFATVWFALIDLMTGEGISVNAGHEYPAVCRAGGSYELIRSKHSISIGVMPGIRYRDAEFYLAPGDKVFLYTDGVPEATDGENRMFTLDRMLVTLNTVKNGSPEEILEGVHQEVNAFVGEAPQFDDLTMLCLEYKGR